MEKNLTPGETILYQSRLHFVSVLGFIVLAGLLDIGTAVLLYFLGVGFWALGFLAGTVFLFIASIIYHSAEFIITNKRVVMKTGLLKIRFLEMSLTKIESISTEQGLFARMFNYGSVVITGSGGTHDTFRYVQKPHEFRNHLLEQGSASLVHDHEIDSRYQEDKK